WLAGTRIDGVIAIAGAVADPTEAAAIGHRHRHLMSAGREQAAERRLLAHPAHRVQQIMLDRPRKTAQQQCALADRLARRQNVGTVKQIRRHLASWKITPTV